MAGFMLVVQRDHRYVDLSRYLICTTGVGSLDTGQWVSANRGDF